MSREVFAEIIPSKTYDCFMLACDMVKMLYGKYRIINDGEMVILLNLNQLFGLTISRQRSCMVLHTAVKMSSIPYICLK